MKNLPLTACTLAILFRILVLVFGFDIFIFFSFQCSIIHVWVISWWCHRKSHFERNISEQFYFENNFFEIIISKLFSTAQDQTRIWIRITRIREFPEDIQGQNKLDDTQNFFTEEKFSFLQLKRICHEPYVTQGKHEYSDCIQSSARTFFYFWEKNWSSQEVDC